VIVLGMKKKGGKKERGPTRSLLHKAEKGKEKGGVSRERK